MREIVYHDRTNEYRPSRARGTWGDRNMQGHRTFHTDGGDDLYLFDDEVESDEPCEPESVAPNYIQDADERVRNSLYRLNNLLSLPYAPDGVIVVEAAMFFDRIAARYGPRVWAELGAIQVRRYQESAGWCSYHADDPQSVARIVAGESCCEACVEADRAMEKEL